MGHSYFRTTADEEGSSAPGSVRSRSKLNLESASQVRQRPCARSTFTRTRPSSERRSLASRLFVDSGSSPFSVSLTDLAAAASFQAAESSSEAWYPAPQPVRNRTADQRAAPRVIGGKAVLTYILRGIYRSAGPHDSTFSRTSGPGSPLPPPVHGGILSSCL